MRVAGLLIFIVILIIVGIFSAYNLRFLKTLFLISQTKPFEREISGAPTILVLGDSTGYGTGVKNSEDSIAGLVASDFPNYSIINNSVNGRTIGDLLPVSKDVDGHYKLILLQIGANDILQGRKVEEVRPELRSILENLRPKADNIVMMSSGNIGGTPAFSGKKSKSYVEQSRVFREMYIEEVTLANAKYVDLFQEPEDDVFIKDPKKYLAMDDLHPSVEGYRYWYKSLKPVLQAMDI